jgi:malate dehydrogenase
MSFIAIAGAGAIGGALAHKLASRGRVPDVRLIDADVSIARGKALDILQSSPVEGFSTRVSAAEGIEAASGAAAVVIADAAKTNEEHAGEGGLALLRRLVSIEPGAPIVFAGPSQRELMARAVRELHVQPRRVIGSAAAALESAVRALTALELDGTGVEVQLRVVGVPPHAAVIAWEEATAFGMPVTTLVPPHRLAAISAWVAGLWPPGPYALASAAARVAEAVMNGSRRRYTSFVSIDEPPNRGAVTALPAEVGPQGIVRVLQPALTRQERTRLENGLSV